MIASYLYPPPDSPVPCPPCSFGPRITRTGSPVALFWRSAALVRFSKSWSKLCGAVRFCPRLGFGLRLELGLGFRLRLGPGLGLGLRLGLGVGLGSGYAPAPARAGIRDAVALVC